LFRSARSALGFASFLDRPSLSPKWLVHEKLGLGAADADIGQHSIIESRKLSPIPAAPPPLT
jgi:hypothetical protein